jgi:hypothetical protein
MNKIQPTLIFFFLTIYSFSQNLDKSYFKFNVDTIDLSSYESIYNKKEFLLNCCNHILESKPQAITTEAIMNCYSIIFKLQHGTFNTNLTKIHPKKLIKTHRGKPSPFILLTAQTKLILEDKSFLYNDTNLVRESIKIYLDYCFSPKNNIRPTKEMLRVNKLRELGKLEDYIQELLDVTYKTKKG